MKNVLLILITFVILPTLKGQTTFQKTYDGSTTSDFGRYVQQTTDGGFIITGQTSLGTGPSDMYLVKTTSNGTIEWAKTFGGAGNEYGYCVQQTSDGGYIIVGNTDSYVNGGPWDIYLVKTTSNGTLQWSKTFGGTGIEEGKSVKEANDGGFIITGYTTSFGGGADVYLIKTASDGTLQWSRTYGYLSGTDFGESVTQTNDGGYIITGSTSMDSSLYDVYLVKTTSDGTLEWTKTYGDTLNDRGNDIRQTNDGGYIITGQFGRSVEIDPGIAYYGDVYLIKTTSNGTIQWTKTFGNAVDATGYYVQQTNDGGYIICGERNGPYLIKVSSNGTLQWSKIYGNLLGANGKTSAQQTNDAGYIITGTITNATFDIYVVKTDSLGNSGCNETNPTTIVSSGGIQSTGGIQGAGGALPGTIATQSISGGIETTLCLTLGMNEITKQQSVSIYPNPFSTQTTLYTTNYFNNATLKIYNSLGELIKQINNIYGQTITISRENLASGVYFIQVEDNKMIMNKKLIITD